MSTALEPFVLQLPGAVLLACDGAALFAVSSDVVAVAALLFAAFRAAARRLA